MRGGNRSVIALTEGGIAFLRLELRFRSGFCDRMIFRKVCNFSGSGGSGHALVPLLLLDDRCVERRDLDLDVMELGAAARSRRQHGQLFMVRPGVWDLFFGRVVVLHGAPKDLPALGDQDFTICVQQFDVRHRSVVEHGCFLFLERRPPCPIGPGMTRRLTVGCATIAPPRDTASVFFHRSPRWPSPSSRPEHDLENLQALSETMRPEDTWSETVIASEPISPQAARRLSIRDSRAPVPQCAASRYV